MKRSFEREKYMVMSYVMKWWRWGEKQTIKKIMDARAWMWDCLWVQVFYRRRRYVFSDMTKVPCCSVSPPSSSTFLCPLKPTFVFLTYFPLLFPFKRLLKVFVLFLFLPHSVRVARKTQATMLSIFHSNLLECFI